MFTTLLTLLIILIIIIIGFGVYIFRDKIVETETPSGRTSSGSGTPSGPTGSGSGTPSGPTSSGSGTPSSPTGSGSGTPSSPTSSGSGTPSSPTSSGSGTPSSPTSSGSASRSGTPFSLIDTNGDNFASREELSSQNVPRLDEMFETFDINQDGKLSMAEIGGMLQSRGPPTKLDDKNNTRYFLVTSDDKYVIKPKIRGYTFVSTGGNISKEHLKTLVKPIVVRRIPDTNNKYYIGMGKTASGDFVTNGLHIRSGHHNGRDNHMVWFGGTAKPKVILPGNNNTFNIFMAEDDTSVPNIEIGHSNGDFDHDFLSQTIFIGGVRKDIIHTTLDEQRLKIPSPFVNSLLDGKWKFVKTS